MAHDDKLQREISALLGPHRLLVDVKDLSEWALEARKVLKFTPGHTKSYMEIEAELIAGGVTVPPGIAMLADAERDKDRNT